MNKKKWLIGMAAALFALLFATGCSQAAGDDKPSGTPGVLVTAISIAGVNVTPLPTAAASIDAAIAASVVVDTERPPTADETADKVY
jgi:hypothetical protein